MVHRIDMGQHLGDTLTPTEIHAARQAGDTLLGRAKEFGVKGGIRVHTIGPQETKFRHEVSIIGEIQFADKTDKGRFEQEFALTRSRTKQSILGQPIECILMPKGMRSAPRYLIAGTSWGSDLDEVGAEMNCEARRHTHIRGQAGRPAGLRGALAWPPLYLLSGAAFWSRAAMLTAPGKYRHYAPFGEWIEQMPADTKFESRSQRRKRRGTVRLGTPRRDPVHRLKWRQQKSGASVSTVAQLTGCHRSTLDRLFRHRKGSPELIKAVSEALDTLETVARAPVGKRPKFNTPAEVKRWLDCIGKSQNWLARQIGWSRSRVRTRES